jgi:hypothetical protein
VRLNDSPARELPGQAKRFANVRAKLALAGYTLEPLDDGYRVGRWGLTRDLADLGAVEAFVGQITGRRP